MVNKLHLVRQKMPKLELFTQRTYQTVKTLLHESKLFLLPKYIDEQTLTSTLVAPV